MIPLITQTPRLQILAASRALLTAELHKPQYFPVLLGAAMPASWPPTGYDREAMEYFLEKLTAGGRDAAVRYHDPAPQEPGTAAFAATALALFEGPSDDPVTVTAARRGRGEASWADFAEAIFEEAGLDTRVRRIATGELGRPASRPAYSVLRSEKGAPTLPYWREGLRECLARIER